SAGAGLARQRRTALELAGHAGVNDREGVLVEGCVVVDRAARPLLAARRELRRLAVIALVFLAIGSLLGYGIAAAPLPRPPPPVPAVARYTAGVQRTDGAEIWASMSPDFQAQAIREGDTPASFAAFYEQMKARGNGIDQVQYAGG